MAGTLKRTIVTGATGGIGAAATEALASRGVPVLMACRNLAKAEAVRAGILGRVPGADLAVGRLDLSSLQSVRAFAEGVEEGTADALFHNAGVISKSYGLTGDGLENTFAVNYFGPWLLTMLLLPKLPADARIVSMVSLTCRFVPLDLSSLHTQEKDFTQLGTYARAKRALMSFSMELARRRPELAVNLADPGIVGSDMIDLGKWFDPIADAVFKPFCKSPRQGAVPALRALASSGGEVRYYRRSTDSPVPARYVDPALDARLWEATAEILGM